MYENLRFLQLSSYRSTLLNPAQGRAAPRAASRAARSPPHHTRAHNHSTMRNYAEIPDPELGAADSPSQILVGDHRKISTAGSAGSASDQNNGDEIFPSMANGVFCRSASKKPPWLCRSAQRFNAKDSLEGERQESASPDSAHYSVLRINAKLGQPGAPAAKMTRRARFESDRAGLTSKCCWVAQDKASTSWALAPG
jgi:hypothetical protein